MQQEPNVGFWNTCYTNGITACATFSGGPVDWSPVHPDAPPEWHQPHQFLGGWNDNPIGSEPFRIIAWGLKWPTPARLEFYTGDDATGWYFNQIPNQTFGAWTGFNFIVTYPDFNATYPQEWDFAIFGPHYEAYVWQGYWIDGVIPSLAGATFAWRGETEDHRLTFDCIQAEAGSTQCQSFNDLNATVVTPEPGTLALLLTGFALVALVRRYTRRTAM